MCWVSSMLIAMKGKGHYDLMVSHLINIRTIPWFEHRSWAGPNIPARNVSACTGLYCSSLLLGFCHI